MEDSMPPTFGFRARDSSHWFSLVLPFQVQTDLDLCVHALCPFVGELAALPAALGAILHSPCGSLLSFTVAILLLPPISCCLSGLGPRGQVSIDLSFCLPGPAVRFPSLVMIYCGGEGVNQSFFLWP